VGSESYQGIKLDAGTFSTLRKNYINQTTKINELFQQPPEAPDIPRIVFSGYSNIF
jgi:hypothetical protein